jgi:hypothetical protein
VLVAQPAFLFSPAEFGLLCAQIEPDVLKQISKSVSEGSFGSYIQFGSLMLNGMRYDLLAGSYSAPWVLKSVRDSSS